MEPEELGSARPKILCFARATKIFCVTFGRILDTHWADQNRPFWWAA